MVTVAKRLHSNSSFKRERKVKMSKQQNRRASCSECPGTYELIPPPDPEYSEPKEKPTSEDNTKRIYECDVEHHRNTIYWHKKEYFFATSDDSTQGGCRIIGQLVLAMIALVGSLTDSKLRID